MWNPNDYAQNSNNQLQWAQELRQRLTLQGHESVLDVGCGDGKITADFAAALSQGRVVGVDSSAEMIVYATRSYPSAQYPNLIFACMDARALEFDLSFDAVFSNAALHWVDDHRAFLNGANRALHANGRLVISCGGQGNAAEVLQVFSTMATVEPWGRYLPNFHNPYFFCGTQDYEVWLRDAEFTIDRLELVPKDMTHPGKAGLANWIRTTWMPVTYSIPELERESFIADFVDGYLAQIPLDAIGLAHVAMVRLEVEASKN